MPNRINHKVYLLIEGNIRNINNIDKIIKTILGDKDNKKLNLQLSRINVLNIKTPTGRLTNFLEVTLLDNIGPAINISRFWGILSKINRTIREKTNIQTKLPSLLSYNPIEEEFYNKNVEVIDKFILRKSSPEKNLSSKIKSPTKKKISPKRKLSVKKKKLP
tara:strand:+ start:1482 stop:1967 length:486 start_codon:yes stop_codon:yes gene_type:complete